MRFRAVRAELVDTGRLTERAFHDAVLERGSMPVELVRAALTDLRLTRDQVAVWRFGSPPAAP